MTLSHLVHKDLLRRLRAPSAYLILIAFPLVFSLLLGLAFGRKGGGYTLPKIKVILVDDDQGFVSGMIGSAATRGELANMLELVPEDSTTGYATMERGKATALLHLPRGLTSAVLAGEPVTIKLLKNPAETFLPLVVEEMVKCAVAVLNGAATILGEPLSLVNVLTRESGFPADTDVAQAATGFNQSLRRVADYLFPPLLWVRSEEETEDEGADMSTVALYMLPGVGALSILILGMIAMQDLLTEKRLGTLRRQMAAPLSVSTILAAKAVVGLVSVAIAVMLVGLVAGIWLGARGDVLGLAALSVALVLAATGFASLMYALFPSEQRAQTVGNIILFMMSFLGGAWFPLRQAPAFIARLSPFTLHYWAVEGYRELLFRDGSLAQVGTNALVLTAVGVVGLLVAAPLLRSTLGKGN
jgi:ABC-2 type transport system permease protein